jgi:hypothetical protein
VDLSYRTQLKGMNELNWERFRATLQAEMAAAHAGLVTLRTEMGAMRGDLLKWMFIYSCGSVIATVGLIAGVGIFGSR